MSQSRIEITPRLSLQSGQIVLSAEVTNRVERVSFPKSAVKTVSPSPFVSRAVQLTDWIGLDNYWKIPMKEIGSNSGTARPIKVR